MRVILMGAALLSMTAAAQAAAPTAEQKAEFLRTCVGISQNEPLCSCKADAAMTLVDGEFMAVIIASMKGATPPAKYEIPYDEYIKASTQACGMGM